MLREYAANPAGAWKSKDCAIYLVVALAVGSPPLKRLMSMCRCCCGITDSVAESESRFCVLENIRSVMKTNVK